MQKTLKSNANGSLNPSDTVSQRPALTANQADPSDPVYPDSCGIGLANAPGRLGCTFKLLVPARGSLLNLKPLPLSVIWPGLARKPKQYGPGCEDGAPTAEPGSSHWQVTAAVPVAVTVARMPMPGGRSQPGTGPTNAHNEILGIWVSHCVRWQDQRNEIRTQ